MIRENNLYPEQGPGAFWHDIVDDIAAGNKALAAEKLEQRPRGENMIPGEINARSTFASIAGAPELAAGYLYEAYQIAPIVVRGNPIVWFDVFSDARKTQAFKDAMEYAGIADYWRSTGNWADKCRPLEGSDDFECF